MSSLSHLVDTQGSRKIQTVTLSFFRFDRLESRFWVLGQMALARLDLMKIAGIQFWKLCGSGTGEGFTPVPNTRVWAILAVWDSEDSANAALSSSKLFGRWRKRASEHWTVHLAATSARGTWSGRSPFEPETTLMEGPLAALTRAAIRPRRLLRFWKREPGISAVIGADPNVAFKIGIGEIPWLQQVTFSIWPDARAMDAFARGGPHASAIRAVRRESWFREELYARFQVTGSSGSWGGVCPLKAMEGTPS